MAAEYLDEVLFYPTRIFFPKVRVTNFDFLAKSMEFGIPDHNGHLWHMFGGSIMGSHQNPVLYSTHDFTSLVRMCNLNRMAHLTDPTVPIMPYIAGYTYKWDYIPDEDYERMFFGNISWYYEVIAHTFMMGAEAVIAWIPYYYIGVPHNNLKGFGSDGQIDFLSRTLNQIEEVIENTPFPKRRTLVTEMLSPRASYVLTGLDCTDFNVYRFTPSEFLFPDLDELIVSLDPLTIDMGFDKIVFPEGSYIKTFADDYFSDIVIYYPTPWGVAPHERVQFHEKDFGGTGLWIITPPNTEPVIS
jgi:hypothetical protein